jgi:catechol 2,3-dioxygenase-like lactoylglutathione lyase family enzyme
MQVTRNSSDIWETRVSGWPTFVIFGAHVIVYSKDAEADRAFVADVLGFSSVDAGHGWLIFALPPAEVAVHPAEENGQHELFLMCDDLETEILKLTAKGVRCSEVQRERWGSMVRILLPGGGEIGLYQPKHPTPLI